MSHISRDNRNIVVLCDISKRYKCMMDMCIQSVPRSTETIDLQKSRSFKILQIWHHTNVNEDYLVKMVTLLVKPEIDLKSSNLNETPYFFKDKCIQDRKIKIFCITFYLHNFNGFPLADFTIHEIF